MHDRPAAGTSFVGRRSELATLTHLLAASRLLTLTGAGGTGKTRLATELVRRARANVAWVDLAPVRDPAAVSPAVENALRIHGDGNLRAAALAQLGLGRRLVVLDNCEHLLPACAAVSERLLSASAMIRVLATTRAPLGVRQEQVWRVPPLALPQDGEREGNAAVRADAVRLFIERTRDVGVLLPTDDATLGRVVAICARLEGLPLAIELAAARLRHLSITDLHDRIAVGLLARSVGDPKHRTMRAALDWSYDLLDARQRTVLRRVSLFAGGFTLASAEAVCGDVGDVLDAVARLVDHSLLEFVSPAARYRLLEPIREYALEQLEKAGELESATLRSARHLVELCTEQLGVDRNLPNADARVRDEFANAAAVMPWLIGHDSKAALRLITRFGSRHWSAIPVHASVVSAWLTRALDAHPARDRTRAVALLARVSTDLDYQSTRADLATARRSAAEALDIAAETDDQAVRSEAELALAGLAVRMDTAEVGLHAYNEVVPRLVDTRLRALALSRRSVLKQVCGDPGGAQADLAAAFAAWDEHGDPSVTERTLTMFCAGEIAFLAGDTTGATMHLRGSIRARRDAGEEQEATPFELLAHAMMTTGDQERALRLAGIAERLRDEFGLWVDPQFALADRSWLAALERDLGSRAGKLRAEGRAMSHTDAVAYALGERTADRLTGRERAVADLVAEGLSNKEIAARLRISARTAENHVQRIRDKLGLRSRAQIALWSKQ